MHHDEPTQTETRLACLALNEACRNGELETASLKFFESLRHRGVQIEDFAPDSLVRTIHLPITFFELQGLAQRLGRCPVCHHKTL
jgi:hypothetical protein